MIKRRVVAGVLWSGPVVAFCVAMGAGSAAFAHEGEAHCAAVTASVDAAGFGQVVDVTCDGGQAVLTSDTFPDHSVMTGIVGSNEQVPVPALEYAAPIPLAPQLGTVPQTRDAALGVAVNGVPIYDYTGGGEMRLEDLSHHQVGDDTVLTQQLDICGGHAGRGDDYHYHASPVCMIAQMDNAGPEAILGWAFDGYPIYGDTNPDGSPIAAGDLDVCNGQADAVFGYRYHTSEVAPYIIQCLMGAVADMRDLPRVPPLERADWGWAIEPGVPPRGGVQDLTFEHSVQGVARMAYTYQGEAYYIQYAPSGVEGCYDFEMRRVTDGGDLVTAEMCRSAP